MGRRAARAGPAIVLAVTLAVVVYYAERLLYGSPELVDRARRRARGARVRSAARVVLAGSRCAGAGAGGRAGDDARAVLAISVGTDITAIDNHVSDAGYVGALPAKSSAW